ncbi:lytic transglycosylase domain-containing protein [Lacibacter sediminis]|uniref:Lytic transglycosylase domain-containing protein n=1 Tax=Lacibacter sediminis TaxID=2760713 RepID=A0A7G5XCH3_9BACT|nr:lytic transglycosylase domain-containing protein [Lacibacter sediminis]QNA43176.1 lytic transglycosylase domain-containing protein [Lacibacter sediminis]
MKTTLWKQVGLSIILLPVCNRMYAKSPQQPHESLLSHLYVTNAVLHDSLIAKTTAAKNLIIPTVQLQSSVRGFVDQYLDEHAEMLENIKERNSSTFKTIQKILVKRGIPAELIYLAVVESKLKNSATSGVGAAGVWQLMPVTARHLGLRVEGKTDERRYLYKSSAAAADYLVELYKQFDDWLLVVAAYNCGSGNVYKAIKQSGSREFWKLQRYLPSETRNHVKRFIATHFYYEGEGSLATLTKTERNIYLASLIEAEEETNETDSTPAKTNQRFNWVSITQHEGEMNFLLRK